MRLSPFFALLLADEIHESTNRFDSISNQLCICAYVHIAVIIMLVTSHLSHHHGFNRGSRNSHNPGSACSMDPASAPSCCRTRSASSTSPACRHASRSRRRIRRFWPIARDCSVPPDPTVPEGSAGRRCACTPSCWHTWYPGRGSGGSPGCRAR